MVWFVIITPEVAHKIGGNAFFMVHSNIALFFVTITLLWYADYLRRGLASRPGPKLPPWARVVHALMHRALIWGLFFVALTGFLLGLTSSKLLKAGGFLPIAPPLGMPEWNDFVGQVHIIEFYTLGVLATLHGLFHVWRHTALRDNALRIMAPRALHRFL